MILAALMAALVSACSSDTSPDALPALNDENCAPEVIKKIKSKSAQQEFASLCFRRGGFVPSEKKEW